MHVVLCIGRKISGCSTPPASKTPRLRASSNPVKVQSLSSTMRDSSSAKNGIKFTSTVFLIYTPGHCIFQRGALILEQFFIITYYFHRL